MEKEVMQVNINFYIILKNLKEKNYWKMKAKEMCVTTVIDQKPLVFVNI